MIAQSNFDLVIIDEAHKMSASRYGNEIRDTARYALGKRLAEHSRNLLLMTATPHNGNDDDFSLFMQLIDPDRFEIRHQGNSMPSKDDLSDVMRRLVKEKLIKFDGTPLFPARIAHTMAFELTGEELELYERVTDYVRSQFNRAENLAAQKRNNIGFALQVLQRRLASSPLAIYNTLKKRRQKLQDLYEKCQWASSPSRSLADSFDDIDAPYQDDDDMSAIEAEDNAENAVESLSTAIDLDELDAEIQTLQDLEKRAEHLYISGRDCKWQQLSALLQGDDNPCNVFASRETAPKLIVFTEHRDTLQYLSKKLEDLLGSPDAIVQIPAPRGATSAITSKTDSDKTKTFAYSSPPMPLARASTCNRRTSSSITICLGTQIASNSDSGAFTELGKRRLATSTTSLRAILAKAMSISGYCKNSTKNRIDSATPSSTSSDD